MSNVRFNLTVALSALCCTLPVIGEAETSAQRSVSDYSEVTQDSMIVEKFNQRVDRIEDMPVYTSTGEHVGEVEELLMDKQNKIVAAAVEIDNIWDFDDDEVIVSLESLKQEDNKLVASLTKEELKALPVWKD